MKLVDSVKGWFKNNDDITGTTNNAVENQAGSQSAGNPTVDCADLQQTTAGQPEISLKTAREHLNATTLDEKLISLNSIVTDLDQQGSNGKILADALKAALKIPAFENQNLTVSYLLKTAADLGKQDISTASPEALLAEMFLGSTGSTSNTADLNAFGKIILGTIESIGTPNEQLLAGTTLDAVEQAPGLCQRTVLNVLQETAGRIEAGTDGKNPVELLAEAGQAGMKKADSSVDKLSLARIFLKKIHDIGGSEDKLLYTCCVDALNKNLHDPLSSGINLTETTFSALARGTTGENPGTLLAGIGKSSSGNATDGNDAGVIASSFLNGIITHGSPNEKCVAAAGLEMLKSPLNRLTVPGIAGEVFSAIKDGVDDRPASRSLGRVAGFCMNITRNNEEELTVARAAMQVLSESSKPEEASFAKIALDILSQKYASSPLPALRVMTARLCDEQFTFSVDQIQALADDCAGKQSALAESDVEIIKACIRKGTRCMKGSREMTEMHETLKTIAEGSEENPSIRQDEKQVTIDGVSLKKRKAKVS